MRHVYDKKHLKNESGFISFLPLDKSSFELQFNAIQADEIEMQLTSEKGTNIPLKISSLNLLDLSFLIPGKYVLEVTVGSSTSRSEIKI